MKRLCKIYDAEYNTIGGTMGMIYYVYHFEIGCVPITILLLSKSPIEWPYSSFHRYVKQVGHE